MFGKNALRYMAFRVTRMALTFYRFGKTGEDLLLRIL